MADVGSDSTTLKSQYDIIQQRTQQNLALRKKKKEEKEKKTKEKTAMPISTDSSIAFGIDDDLDLKLADPPNKSSIGLSEELVEHLNQQIRELKDETGRLYKLLSERDIEMRTLRKKLDQQKSLTNAAGSGNIGGDVAAQKIVDLSKKLREQTAELEKERTKCRQWAKKCYDLEQDKNMDSSNINGDFTDTPNEKKQMQDEINSLQDKLKHSDQRTSEFRNQCQSLRQEIKVAQKVLTSEIGEGVNIQQLLNAPSGWRGRAQQIIALQKKVQELRAQVESHQLGSRASEMDGDLEASFMGCGMSITTSATSRRSLALDERNREQIRKMDKEKREANERMANEIKAMEQDQENMKNKWEASKARNKVLSTEVKGLKAQISTLLEKGKHDDELIEALMKQLAQLKSHLEEKNGHQRDLEQQEESQRKERQLRQQQEENVINQLKAIVSEKEMNIKKLQDEISCMRLNEKQQAQVQAVFDSTPRCEATPRWAVPGNNGRPMSANSPPGSAQNGRAMQVSSARMSSRPGSRQTTHIQDNPMFASERPPSVERPASRNGRKPGSARNKRNSMAGDHNPAVDELQLSLAESQSLYQAALVERDRLKELVQIQEKRCEEANGKMLNAQQELQGQKRKNVQLEKQLGKASVDQSSAKNVGKKLSASSLRLRAPVMDSLDEDHMIGGMQSLEELQTNLEIQRDENEALKMALQRTLRAKEEDLKLYNDIMEETKNVFLQGLMQYKHKTEA